MKTVKSNSYQRIALAEHQNLYVLTDLPYAYAALEPVIDAKTMKLHHRKHHATYLENLLNEIDGTNLMKIDPYELACDLTVVPEEKLQKVQNNLGGFINHNIFFKMMRKPSANNKPEGVIADLINDEFGSFNKFKKDFIEAAKNHFGSGWVWLCIKNNKVTICTTKNQDNPLMGKKFAGCDGTPILGLDVWEHAYYLKYQNKRADYVKAWFDVIDWDEVQRIYETDKMEKSASRKDLLSGGRADKAKESDFDAEELAKGIKTEMEHTNNKNLAKEIAMDHLTEDAKYYTKLLRAGL
jgi:Fe-Mn family superoxide dismutase